MFRCLSCNEVITLGSTTCRFCSVPISPDAARAAAEQFDKVQNACEKANTIKVGNIAAGIFVALQLFLMFTNSLGSSKLFLAWAVPPAALIAVGGWFYKYGSLQTKDPDYPEAKAAMKTSLWIWLGALAVQVLAMVVLIGQAWQSNM
jgi:hypothetical protein